MSSEGPQHQAKPKRRPGKRPVREAFGCLKPDDQRPVSIEDINEAIQKGWAGEQSG